MGETSNTRTSPRNRAVAAHKRKRQQRMIRTVTVFVLVFVGVPIAFTAWRHHRTMSANVAARATMMSVRASEAAALTDDQIAVLREGDWKPDATGKTGVVEVTLRVGRYCHTVSGYFTMTVHPKDVADISVLVVKVPVNSGHGDKLYAEVPVTSSQLTGLSKALFSSQLGTACGLTRTAPPDGA